MNNGTLQRREREREHAFYLISIEMNFHGKVSPSVVVDAIELVDLSDVPFDAIFNKDIHHSMKFRSDLIMSHLCIFSTLRHLIECL